MPFDIINHMHKVKTKLKHLTSSIFIFHQSNDVWRLLFVHHKKFDRWMIPGGHVEKHENPLETVLREAYEETSLRPKLISFIHRKFPATDSKWLLLPEYLFEQRIPAHKDQDEHFHLDCAYVSVVENDTTQHRTDESNDIRWFTADEVAKDTSMFLSTQLMAAEFFKRLGMGNLKEIITYR